MPCLLAHTGAQAEDLEQVDAAGSFEIGVKQLYAAQELQPSSFLKRMQLQLVPVLSTMTTVATACRDVPKR